MTKRIENLEITDIADEGRGLGRMDGRVVFVNHVVPGDIINADIKRKKNKFIEAAVTEYLKYSDHRTNPLCKHFGVCGGCKRQNMQYGQQLFYKTKQVRDALVRIAGIENPAMEEILPSAQVYQYRNRLDFAFSEKEWLTADKLQNKEYQIQPALGFHITGRFDKVLNIDECLLMQEPTNRIRNFVKSFALKENYTFFNRISQHGDLRNMLVRNTTSGQWMVVIMFADADEEKRSRMLNAIKEEFPEITSLYYFINQKKNDTFFDLQPVLWSGTETITENMGGLKFTIGPKTFFQTNPVQANELYKTALSFAALQPHESVYDLYTGTGTIANFLAKQCKRVIGIDNVEDSIVQARLNSESNAIHNTVFFAGDMRETLDASFFEANGFPDVIITDPPRAGMHPDVVNRICNSGAGRIVYVSCNPSTMARDIAMMKDHYTLVKVKPVDMFPQTDHIECVALLEKK